MPQYNHTEGLLNEYNSSDKRLETFERFKAQKLNTSSNLNNSGYFK